jgi:hypothetical protein
MIQALGLYAYAECLRTHFVQQLAKQGKRFVTAVALRVALDAVAISLAIGEGTVEGVRRLATPSAPTLLRHRDAPTPSWVRRILGRFAEPTGETLHLAQATALVRQSERDAAGHVVFYVDNHLRPYTGKHVIRKGWRMQDKRAVSGASDYWVHDEDGRPVLRVHSPEHESLVKWLRPIGRKLHEALADERRRIVLVFDRAGARPEAMAELRDANFDFVTYEVRPYAKLPASAFDHWIRIGKKRYEYVETHQKNLGKGRGRVRRIAMRNPAGEQFNILAVSDAPAHELIGHILARWARQENQFKHGNERWNLNQLDGRTVVEYPPDAIIPNPARRRLDRALRLAREREGEALRKLAHLERDHPKQARLQQELERARDEQRQLEALRPKVPTHAPVRETELAGKLVKHERPYKLLIDTLRVAAANAESELAARLAPHLPRGAEAKKTLANLFRAPGTVRLRRDSVVVILAPAATSRERAAFEHLLAQLNALPLRLPGDQTSRRLRFELEKR